MALIPVDGQPAATAFWSELEDVTRRLRWSFDRNYWRGILVPAFQRARAVQLRPAPRRDTHAR
jgi:hypothetical protein